MAKLTTKFIDNAKPDKVQRREIPDAYMPGLYFIIQPSGAKSWAVRYRLGGRTAKLTLGSYPKIDLKKAHELGAKALRAVAEGHDPAADRKPALASGSVAMIVEQYIERYVARRHRPKTRRGTEHYLEKLTDKLGGRKIGDITRADIRALIESDEPTVADNRLHSSVAAFFNWAVDKEIIAASPCAGLKKPLEKEESRDRELKDGELRQVWRAAESMDGVFSAMFRILALTGQRLGEVTGMRWDELDLVERTWTLPPERTKNKRRHEVPLPPQAIAIIEAIPRVGEYVFTYNGKKPMAAFGRKTDQLRERAGIAHWTLHDVRRTVATGLQRLDVRLEVTEAVLNHVSGSRAGIVGVYQRHQYTKEKRAAVDAWASHVTAIVAGENVVSLVRA